MGLPEVNRARIEKLNQEVDILEAEVNALKGEVENIDPIVRDESFPNIVPPVPTNVRATALFRTIQVTWDYRPDSYIASYEVYASQEENFTPFPAQLVWRGKSGGYTHPASTGETWYFRVRAVNTHGTASEFSEQASATTVDISGLEIEETWRIDLLEEANMYSDEIKNEMLAELANKIDADVFYGNLLLKANVSDVEDRFSEVSEEFLRLDDEISQANAELLRLDDEINQANAELLRLDDEINQVSAEFLRLDGEISQVNAELLRLEDGFNQVNTELLRLDDEISLRVTKTQYDADMNDAENGVIARLNNAEGQLSVLNDAINLRVTKTEYDAGMSGLITRMNSAEGQLTVLNDAINLRVTKTEYDKDIKDEQNGLIARMSNAESQLSVLNDEISLRVTKSQYDKDMNGLITRVGNTESQLSILNDAINLRVTKAQYDEDINDAENGLFTRMSNAEGQLTILNDAINLRVTKTQYDKDMNGLITRVGNAESQLAVLNDAINLRVTKTQYDTDMSGIFTRMNNAEGQLAVLNDEINLRVTKTEYDADINDVENGLITRMNRAEGQLTVLNDAINLRVTKTQYDADINDVENGLIARMNKAEGQLTVLNNEISLRVTKAQYDQDIDGIIRRVDNAEGQLTVLNNAINLRVTQAQYDADINDEQNGLIARMNNAEGQLTVLNDEISLRVTEEELDIRMGDVVHRLDLHEAELVTLSDEIALRVTHTEFDALNTRVTEAEGEISTLAGQVELRATKSELDAVDERLSTAEAKLIVQANQISQRVEKNGIIASINLSPETLKINVAKMEINGDLEVVNGLVKLKNLIVDSAHIKDGAIVKRMFAQNAVVDTINTGTALIDFAKIGNVQITNAHITGQLDASKIRIGAGTTFENGYDPTKLYDADAINLNPRFSDWTGTYPAGYTSVISSNGSSFSKATSPNSNGNAVKFVVGAGGNCYLNPVGILNKPFVKYVTVEISFMLESGSIDGAGVLFRYRRATGAGIDHKIHLKDLVPTPTLGVWYTVSKTIKQSDLADFDRYFIFPMGGFTSFGTVTAKTIHFDYIKARPSTEQEINAYEAGIVVNSWLYTGTTEIDGGKIRTNTITANKINVSSLSALSANLGTVTAGTIKGVSITGSTITQSSSGGSIILNNNGLTVRDSTGKDRIQIQTSTSSIFADPSYMVFEPTRGVNKVVIGTSLHGLTSGLFLGFPEDTSESTGVLIKCIGKPDNSIAFWSPRVIISDGTLELPPNRYVSAGGGINANNSDIINVNSLRFADPGAGEGVVWDGGNGWMIVEAPNNMGNGAGNLQFATGESTSNRKVTIGTDGSITCYGSGGAVLGSFNGGSVDLLDTTGAWINLYLRPATNGEVRVTANGSWTTYRPVRASSFPTGSSILYKTNIESLSEEEAMFLLNNADVFTYHLKSNVENGIYDKPKVGMIAEMVPQKLRDEDGVDPYSIVSTLWKVVQVQQRKIEELLNRVSTLEEVV